MYLKVENETNVENINSIQLDLISGVEKTMAWKVEG